MDKETLDRQVEIHLSEIINDKRVQNFIAAIENLYSQQSINRILQEKAQTSDVDKKDYTPLIELLQILEKGSSDLNKSISPSLKHELTENIKKETIYFTESINKYKAHIEILEIKNKELDQFAYVVAHDLKAPLRGIFNLVEWIEEDLKETTNSEIELHLKMLRNRIIKLENLIHGILRYTKSGKIKTSQETIETKSFISEIIELLHPPKNTIIEIDESCPLIETDPIQFHQVLSNLISNAIKYNNKEQIIIKIGCQIEKEHYEFFVEDNGSGIEKEYYQKIFQLFQTVETSKENLSTGIGLNIAKNIIEELGGTIRVESNIDVGSKFTFSWPKKAKVNIEKMKA